MTFKFTRSMEEPMGRSATSILAVLMIALSACDGNLHRSNSEIAVKRPPEPAPSPAAARTGDMAKMEQGRNDEAHEALIVPAQPQRRQSGQLQEVPLDSAGAAQAFMRKVI